MGFRPMPLSKMPRSLASSRGLELQDAFQYKFFDCFLHPGVWHTGEATASKAEVWVDMVTEGGRRFITTWRQEEVDAARHRQEKREATRLGELLIAHGGVEFCETTHLLV